MPPHRSFRASVKDTVSTLRGIGSGVIVAIAVIGASDLIGCRSSSDEAEAVPANDRTASGGVKATSEGSTSTRVGSGGSLVAGGASNTVTGGSGADGNTATNTSTGNQTGTIGKNVSGGTSAKGEGGTVNRGGDTGAASGGSGNSVTGGSDGVEGGATAPTGVGGNTAVNNSTSNQAGSSGRTGSGGTSAKGGGGSVSTKAEAGSGGVSAGSGVGGNTGVAGESQGGVVKGTLPPVTSVEEKGPYAVTIDEKAGENSWVFRPTDLGRDGVKHPIFVWGTGATSTPSQYKDHFNHIASHGFVVISPNTGSVNAKLLKASLDWILEQNKKDGTVYYQKLDETKIAMGGHSLGSMSTFDAESTETRLTTTIHIAGGSRDGSGSSKVKTPTAYICGETDMAKPNCDKDFEKVEDQPTFYAWLTGVDHVSCARKALPGMTAWLRWHLAGETERKAMFTKPGGEFYGAVGGTEWNSDVKNWEKLP